MVHGPNNNENANAVNAAITARNVVYWNRFSADKEPLKRANHKNICNFLDLLCVKHQISKYILFRRPTIDEAV